MAQLTGLEPKSAQQLTERERNLRKERGMGWTQDQLPEVSSLSFSASGSRPSPASREAEEPLIAV